MVKKGKNKQELPKEDWQEEYPQRRRLEDDKIHKRKRLNKKRWRGILNHTLDSEFPWLVEFIVIIPIKIIGVFFDFERFSNHKGGVIRWWCKDFFLVKTNKVFRIVELFGDDWLIDLVVECVNYMFFKTCFDWSTYLANGGFPTRTWNLINSLS